MKLADIVGLYVDPPAHAVVQVDRLKSQILKHSTAPRFVACLPRSKKWASARRSSAHATNATRTTTDCSPRSTVLGWNASSAASCSVPARAAEFMLPQPHPGLRGACVRALMPRDPRQPYVGDEGQGQPPSARPSSTASTFHFTPTLSVRGSMPSRCSPNSSAQGQARYLPFTAPISRSAACSGFVGQMNTMPSNILAINHSLFESHIRDGHLLALAQNRFQTRNQVH